MLNSTRFVLSEMRARNRGVICPSGCLPEYVSSPFCKNILIFRKPNHLIQPSPPAPLKGRVATVTDAGLDAVDAEARRTGAPDADGEVVWS